MVAFFKRIILEKFLLVLGSFKTQLLFSYLCVAFFLTLFLAFSSLSFFLLFSHLVLLLIYPRIFAALLCVSFHRKPKTNAT